MIDRQQQYDKLVNENCKHKQRMMSAIEGLRQVLPLDGERYQHLTEDEIALIDQYLFRFAKLQDATGQRLFREAMMVLDEDTEKMAFVDILNRLEKLGRLESADTWRRLRKIRDHVSHECGDNPEYIAAALNAVFDARKPLFELLQNVADSNG